MAIETARVVPTTPRSRGRPGAASRGRLVFGQMFEDHRVELTALPRGRLLCVASAGDTAFALAGRGDEVTAVDVNPAQLRYVRERLSGGPVRAGAADRLLAAGRGLLRHTGWHGLDLEGFCGLADPGVQAEVWRDRLDTRAFRAVLAALLSPGSVRGAGFSAFTRPVPARFDVVMRQRLAAGVGSLPNRDNPFLRRLLTGVPVPVDVPSIGAVRLLRVDLLEHLESVPPASYDGFSLSNVLDGAEAGDAQRLRAAVRRAAAPGAVAVYRSFGSTTVADDAARARSERAMIWGAVRVEHPGSGR